MLGRSFSHYRIVSYVGAGATGEVYKAEDTRLQRFVAIKVMMPDLAADAASKRRFIQEARAASALDHQNICTVHDIGETEEGRLFIVMSFYEGETLLARIRRGSVPIDEVIRITLQISAGLARAHDYGIVHRDIKPANLLVTQFGEVRILDFGLAKLREDDTLDSNPLIRHGTVRYMSPEQASGGPVDHRSDIWSLGVVIYEMLAGRRPFDSDSNSGVVRGILYDEPRSVGEVRPETPTTLRTIVERALSKSREARIQSCHDIVRVLGREGRMLDTRDVEPAAPPPPQRSIMVMPFVSLGGDSESEYFGHGLADEITTRLSRVSALRVMARTAGERARASGRQFREVARDLGVEYVVDGAVRRQGSSLRVSANLVEARGGSLLWSDQFSGTLEDIFAIQENLSRQIVEALRLRLDAAPTYSEVQLADIEAYTYYLKAKQEFVRYAPGGLERALNYIEAARAKAGENVLLLTAAGQIYWQLVNSGSTSDRRFLDKARACAERVLQLDPESAHGYRLLGMVSLSDGDIRSTIARLETALSKEPNDTDTLSLLGPCYGYVGRPQLGVPCLKLLLDLDPVTPMYQALPGYLSLMAGSFDEALEPFATSYALDPGNPIVHLSYGQALGLNGQTHEAIGVFDELQRMHPNTFMARIGQLYKCALRGQSDEWARWITADVEAIADWDLYHSWNLAECFALLGDTDRGLKWLARAAARGMLNYPLRNKLDPFIQRRRSDSRFTGIMREVHRAWEDMSGDVTGSRTV
jgi:serine/threonine protein kinase/tetratricopeptide (TPR) repeat protein